MASDPVDIAALLRAADRKVLGADFARRIGDLATADRIDKDAVLLYMQALSIDPTLQNPAWSVVENRDKDWLNRRGLDRVPSA